MSDEIVAALRQVPAFTQLPEVQLAWLASRSEVVKFQPGEQIFVKGAPALYMIVVLEGRARIQTELNGQGRSFGQLNKHAITGVLPFSRLKTSAGYGIAMEPTTILRLHRDHLAEMEKVAPDMVKVLVEVMTNRVREFTSFQQQNEKMVALGKLSAGLAHELNNPAAALVRGAAELKRRMSVVPERFKGVLYAQMTPEAVEATVALLSELACPPGSEPLDPVERSEWEEELADWLEKHGVVEGALFAGTFLEARLGVEALETLRERVPVAALPALIGWLENSLASDRLIRNIEEAARRISALVKSVKTYSHMDRSPDREPIDLAPGIKSTLTMMGHKLREKDIGIKLDLPADLPRIWGWADELNQVWTNLIDNAVDAMEKGGRMEITAAAEDDQVAVRVIDNGSGIPENIKSKIFDPFFSTKEVGQGTGLGLDVARRIAEHHGAEIRVDSRPGRTEFTLRFPLETDF